MNSRSAFITKLIKAGIEENEAKKEVLILFSEFGEAGLQKIKKIVDKRVKTREPIQYLIGSACFMDFEVEVNKHVLVPRPETEILIEETVKRLPHSGAVAALDIGTGSGVIPIALGRLIPDIKFSAIDVNKKIIALAEKNTKRYSLNERIHFKVCDLFSKYAEKLFQSEHFDLIISNPPYVRRDGVTQSLQRQPEILHEPKIALYGTRGNKTGLLYYERIFELVKRYCCRGMINHAPTLVALEIDPPLVKDLKKILKSKRLKNFEIVKDYSKLDRYLFVFP